MTIKIFDIHGAELKILIEDIINAGYHEVNWDGKDSFGNNVPSRIYLYRIQAGAFCQVRKMVLVR